MGVHSNVQSVLGRRHPESEDRFICLDTLDAEHPELSLYAVLDGHGDALAAQFVQEKLPDYFRTAAGYAERDYERATRTCFARLHKELIEDAHSKGGTTISLALIDRRKEGRTFLAFLGDSPIFLRRKNISNNDVYLAFPLHNSSNPAIARNINAIATAPWEAKRHSRGINLYGSLGDALYEPIVNNCFFKHAQKFRDSEEMGASFDIPDPVKHKFKESLLEATTVDTPAWRHATLHSAKTLSYYLTDNAMEMLISPLQRTPDVMSFPTADLDCIAIGSDGAFPVTAFDRILTDLKRVPWTCTEQDVQKINQISTRLITRNNSDDKTLIIVKLVDDVNDVNDEDEEVGKEGPIAA